MAKTRVAVTALLLLLCWSTYQAKAQVTIMVEYDPPPDFTPGTNEYRAGSGPAKFTCLLNEVAATGVMWTSDCSCPFLSSSTNPITRGALTSGDTGTHACRVGEASNTIAVNIVGAGIHIFTGRRSITSNNGQFSLPNNGLVVSLDEVDNLNFRFRIFCRSDSVMEEVRDFIGLNGNPISTGGPFFVERSQAGEISVVNRGGDDVLGTSQQGVYTCRIPDAASITREINIGVYTSGFNAAPTITNALMFTPGSSSSTLTCISTTSIATFVTFMRDNGDGSPITVGPLYDDREPMMFGGVTYELAQTVTNREASTFDNVLTINQQMADIVGSTFSCIVTNSIGSSGASMLLQIMAIMDDPTVSVMTSSVGSGVAGEDYSITCTVMGADNLGATFSIMWLRPGGDVLGMETSTESSLTHTFTPLGESDGGMYTCEATVSSTLLTNVLTTNGTLSVVVTVPTVSIMTSSAGSGVAGEDYSITCTVMGAGNLVATFSIMWLRPGGGVLVMGTESSLTHTFTPLGESDGGMYTCETTVSSTLLTNDLTANGMLSVTVTRPSLTPIISADPESAVFGGSLTLTCSVTHNLGGSTNFMWALADGGTFTGSSLIFNGLTLSSAGTYTCQATITGSPYLTSDFVTASSTRDVSIPIPLPTVDATRSGGSIIYAGSMLTLTCRVTLVGIQPSNDVTAMVTWFGAGGNVLRENSFITVTATQQESSTQYTSTVEFNTLRANNVGTYTCQGTISHTSPFITDAKENDTVPVSPITVPPLMLSVDSNATRLPNVDPFNTFVLTCTATAPPGVVQPKSFTWRRTSGSSGSCSSLTEVSNNASIQIMSSNLQQPVSTSLLTVTESNADMWRYCCQAILTDLDVSGTPNDVLSVEVVGPASPEQPTNLMNVSTLGTSTTIQWTVPIIAYTPETYVINYGTEMDSLDMTSDPVQGGSDFELENQPLSGQLTGLTDTTTYHYQVVATNSLQGSTSSVIQSFMTTILRPGPPLNFMSIMQGTTTLSFSWNPPEPREGVDITQYTVGCEPQLSGIPTPAAVTQSASQPLTATVSSLFPGVTYNCTVAAVNDRGEGDQTEDTAMTQEIAPTGAPQNFNIVPGPTSRELSFSWDLPLPAVRNGMITSYTISCSPDTETLPRVVSEEEGLTVVVGGLRPFTNYSCMIVASNSQGSGPPASNTRRTNEDVPEGPPLSPSVAVTIDPEMLIFTVQPPEEGLRNGEIISYSVNCDPSGAYPFVFIVSGTLTSESGPVGGFTAAVDYDCSFTASTSVGEGSQNVQLSVTTLPDAPVITSVINQSSSEVLVNWNISLPTTTGPGAITRYTIYVDDEGVNTANVTALNYVIRNLVPYQLVTVQVSASTSAGEGNRSAAMTGRSSEAPPGPVSNILWNPQSVSSVDVSWSEPERPNGVILGYSVVLERYVGGIIDSADVDSNTLTTFFNGTQNTSIGAETPYNVTITARNSAGMGDSAKIVNFTMESDSPRPPTDVSIMRSNDGTQMTVSWTPLTVLEARSLIQFYRVFYSPATVGNRKRQSETTCSQSPCDVPGNESSALITGLDPAINYGLQLATVNRGGDQGDLSRVTTMQPPTVEESGSPSSIGPAIGGAVGGVAVVVILLIIIVIVCYKYKKQTKYAPYSSAYGMDTKQEKTPPPPLSETATKSFMQSEEDLATFEPSKTPVAGAITDSQAIERLRAIAVSVFTHHVQEMHEDRDKHFELEYQSISNEPLASYDIAKLPYNKAKNRFANIFPYDFCRVKLQEVEGVEGSDYVNASYVDGYNHPNAYVAAQGPLPNTVTDFWRMVWEHRLNTIVMLTKTVEAGKRKCEQYWPDNVNETFEPPNSTVLVTLTSVMPLADYEVKKFLVKDTSHPDVPPLEVTHLHFLGWPDHGVPKFATSLIGFIRRVRKEHNKDGPPMLVHCSAGVGRTGTFILLDSMLERMKAEETVNVYEYLRNMRAKRVFMVQTLAQYTFIHDALGELITCGDTSITASNLRVKINRLHKVVPSKAIPGFEDQFQLLDKVSRNPVGNDCSDALQPYNKAKNRYLDRLPYNLSRTRLRPTGATGAEYINASFMDGYKQRNTYIAAQAPLQETVSDFWRMIWEFKSKAIVMLCSAEENGQETSYPYWSMGQGVPEIFGKLQITLVSEEPTKDFVIRKFEVKEDKVGQGGPPGFMVTQFHVTQWPEQGRPPSSSTVLGLIDQLIKVQRGTGNRSITVMCNDGMGRTGTFIAIHAQLERVKTEGVVDFFQFVKSSRIQRPFLVSGLEQYIFCHDALADYLGSFDTYANFKDLGPK